jgi:hypothetical protein
MLPGVDFEETLARLGFRSGDTGGSRHDGAFYTAQPNPFMTYTVHAYDDGSAIFTWEFALGEYLAGRGIQVGSDETLNQFMYPRQDARGPQDGAWLVAAIEGADAMLSSLRFDRPES